MEIEHLIRYAPRAVGLKPSAIRGEARLRGLERITYSKTGRNPPVRARAGFMLSASVPIRPIRVDPCSISAVNDCMRRRERISITIRADPSYPCRSVFYFGYARRCPPARAIPDYFFKDHVMVFEQFIRSSPPARLSAIHAAASHPDGRTYDCSWEGRALPNPPAGGGVGKPGFPTPRSKGPW